MNVRGSRFDKAVFAIVVLDLMFFPYIRVISASLSMLILPLWFMLRGRTILNDLDFKLCALAFLIAAYSFLFAFAAYSDGFVRRDGTHGSAFSMAPNTVILLYMLMYFIFFKSIVARYQLSIHKYLMAYFCFVLTLALVFYYDPSLYFKVRSFWTMYDNIIEVSQLENAMFRFTGTLSEPNNLAAIICAIMAYILFFCEQKYSGKLITIVSCSLIVIATMSASGLFVLSAILFILFFAEISNGRKSRNTLVLKVFSVLSILVVAIFSFFYLQETDIGKISTERISSNSMDSRFQIWADNFDLEKVLLSFLWGDGGLVIIDGREINPHNGHLHLIYSYGLVFYILFICLFFSSWIKAPFSIGSAALFIPIAVCFTINVGIYELRFAGLIALLIAYHKVFYAKKSD